MFNEACEKERQETERKMAKCVSTEGWVIVGVCVCACICVCVWLGSSIIEAERVRK